MNVEELARKYYPMLWDRQRIEALVAAGRLSREAADAIMEERSGGNEQTDCIYTAEHN